MGFTLQDIIDTLNQVEVHGKANLDRLLTSIICLEAFIQAQTGEAQPIAEEAPSVEPEVPIYAEDTSEPPAEETTGEGE